MASSYVTNPLVFLVDVIFGLYILAVMLRLLLQWARADFYNPISQFLVKVTNPPIVPLRRVIPPLGRIDMASVVLLLVLQMVTLALIASIKGASIGILPLVIVAIAELVSLLINVFLFAILIQVILSWVNPGAYNPATSLISSLTEPVLAPARKLLPPISGMDLSPLLVLLGLQLAKMLLIPPILALA